MHVLNRITNDFAIKLCWSLLNKKCISNHMYDSEKELFQFYFSFTEKEKDFFYLLTKLMPFVYYEHSKHKLEESDFETIVYVTFPDTRESDDPYRYIGRPIYTGIRIPFDQSSNFISIYKNALNDLLKNIYREKQPEHYYIFPLLTFKNIHYGLPLEHFCDFTSFVEYYGEWWGDLHYYLYGENDFFTINHGFGYQRFTDVNNENVTSSPLINGIESFPSPECVICMSEKPDILFCSCGHLCICSNCFKNYTKRVCPICKTKNQIVREI